MEETPTQEIIETQENQTETEVETLKCSGCSQIFSTDNFYPFPTKIRKRQYSYYCKECDLKRREKFRNTETGQVSYLFSLSKDRAKKNNIPFSIKKEDIVIPKYCPVLPWIELKRGKKEGRNIQSPNSPTLDKIIPELGYVPGNVQVVSWRANELKKDATLEELENIYFYMLKATTKKS